MTSAPTPTARLAEHLLGEPVANFISSRRAEGHAWRIVARDLYEATGGQIDVTYETLRSWFPDESPAAVEVAS